MVSNERNEASKLSLTEQSYVTLRNAILSNQLAPEGVWSDREFCERFDLSRTPVREALLRLQSEGLVEILPRRGTRILPLNASDVREIHQVIKALELEAALTIAQTTDNADALNAVSQTVIAMEDALEKNDLDLWVSADAQFHDEVVSHCENRRIVKTYRSLRGLTDRARYFTLRLRPLPMQSTKEHRQMYEAMRDKRLSDLEALYRCHWDRTTEEIAKLIQEHSQSRPLSPLR